MDVPEVDCAEAVAMRDAGAVWIDVREPDEWRAARIEGTEHVPLSDAVDEVPRRYPDKDTQLVLSCHAGPRSAQLTGYLRSLGYLDVHNLRGGIRAWASEGRAIVTDRS